MPTGALIFITRTARFEWRGNGLYAGRIHFGHVEHPELAWHPAGEWYAWLTADYGRHELGWFATEALARAAVLDAVEHALYGWAKDIQSTPAPG